MKIALIAAISKNMVIGINNALPWKLPDDMRYFMETTKRHLVIMGRKNFDSIPDKFRPLPDRTNVILTRQVGYEVDNCKVFNSLQGAYDFAKTKAQERIFVIGGGQLYKETMDEADELFLTEINADIEGGEVFFPTLIDSWIEVSRVHHPTDDSHEYSFDFVKYEKKQPQIAPTFK